jgi:Tol biopolymer transport system component
MKKIFTLAAMSIAASVALSSNASTSSEVLTVEKLNQLNHLHDVNISPKGDVIIYGLKADNSNNLFKQDIKTGQVSQLTNHEKSESNVIWADDGKSVYFISARSGSSQIWQKKS